jgi:hypothetical protein
MLTEWLKALKKDLLLQVRRQKQRYLKKSEKPKGFFFTDMRPNNMEGIHTMWALTASLPVQGYRIFE